MFRSPLLDKATISLSEGKTFQITAENNFSENIYTRCELNCEKEQNRTEEQDRATDFVDQVCSILFYFYLSCSNDLSRNSIPIEYTF